MVPRKAPRIFYGWWIVAGGIGLQLLANALYSSSFGAYFVYFQREFGWSRTAIAGVFSLARLEGGLLGPLQGWLLDRLGPRAILRTGLVIFGLGLMLVSTIDSLPKFYAAYIVVAFGVALAGFLTVNLVIVNWFDRHRGRAMALAGTGGSIGGILIPLVVVALEVLGWRTTAFISGLIVLAVGLPVAQLFRSAPEPYGYLPDGGRTTVPHPAGERPATSDATTAQAGLTVGAALATPGFWLICVGHAASLVTVSALNVHLIPFLVSQADLSLEAAGSVAAIVTASAFAGQLLGGALSDRLDKRVIATACVVGHGLAVLLLLGATAPLAVACAVLHGVSWGLRGPLMMALRADYFGRRSFPTIEGYANLITTFGAIAGPVLAGFIADRVGDYRPAFVVLAVVAAGGAFCFAIARRPTAHASPVTS